MSRVGRKPIQYPGDVKVQINKDKVVVEGKKGAVLEMVPHPNMTIKHDASSKTITVERPNDDRLNRSLHGLTRTLIANMIHGVSQGFEKKLKIEGLGYQARIDKGSIELSVGYANKIVLTPPQGVVVEVPDPKDPTTIIVKGADKQKVGQFAAEIRASRKPEPYKGKGIRYMNEVIRRKEGKSFAAGG